MDNVFLALLLVSIVGLVYSFIKKKDKKIKLGFVGAIIVFFVLFGMTTPEKETTKGSNSESTTKISSKKEVVKESSSSSSSKQKTKETKKKTTNSSKKKETTTSVKENTSDEVKQFNSEIAKSLQESLGFALGKLDRDGNPTENGTPNPDFEWAIFVDSIVMDNSKDIVANMKNDFLTLTDSEKNEVASRVQGSSISIASQFLDLSTDDMMNGFFLEFKVNNKSVGRSTVLDRKEYKWNK